MACCWSSMRVTPSMNHAPSVMPASAGTAPDQPWASIASPAMQVARSASGPRRSLIRSSTWATRHSPVSASPTTPYPPPRGTFVPRTATPHGPACWLTQRTELPKIPAWRRAWASSASVSGCSGSRSGNVAVSARPYATQWSGIGGQQSLDVVAPREVRADLVGGGTEAVVGERVVEPAEGPVGLAGVVLRPAAGDRRHGGGVVLGREGAGRLDQRDEEAPERAEQLVVRACRPSPAGARPARPRAAPTRRPGARPSKASALHPSCSTRLPSAHASPRSALSSAPSMPAVAAW